MTLSVLRCYRLLRELFRLDNMTLPKLLSGVEDPQ
jgi:hypothetical protein